MRRGPVLSLQGQFAISTMDMRRMGDGMCPSAQKSSRRRGCPAVLSHHPACGSAPCVQ